jgi:hypothetical protein
VNSSADSETSTMLFLRIKCNSYACKPAISICTLRLWRWAQCASRSGVLVTTLAVAVRKVRSITNEATGFVGKSLKGKKPNELAVVQSIKFELVTKLTVLGSRFAQEVTRSPGSFRRSVTPLRRA